MRGSWRSRTLVAVWLSMLITVSSWRPWCIRVITGDTSTPVNHIKFNNLLRKMSHYYFNPFVYNMFILHIPGSSWEYIKECVHWVKITHQCCLLMTVLRNLKNVPWKKERLEPFELLLWLEKEKGDGGRRQIYVIFNARLDIDMKQWSDCIHN